MTTLSLGPIKPALIIALLLLPFQGRGEEPAPYEVEYTQTQPDHFTPLGHPSNYNGFIAKHLFVTSGEMGRFVRLPSFSPESALSVYSITSKEVRAKYAATNLIPPDEQAYFITLTSAKKQLWPALSDMEKGETIEVERVDREISSRLAIAVQRVWAKMLHRTRYPAGASDGMDGVTYHFSVWALGAGELRGRAWSPDKGLVAEMVVLATDLETFALNKKHAEEPLIQKLRRFEAKIPTVK